MVIRAKVPARPASIFAPRFAQNQSLRNTVRKSSTALTRIKPGDWMIDETMFEVTPFVLW